MHLTLEVPAVPGAVEYVFRAGRFWHGRLDEPGSIEVAIAPCVGVGTFDVFAVALDAERSVLGYQLVRDVAHVPDGDEVLALTLSDTTREVLRIDASSLTGATLVRASADFAVPPPESLDGLYLHEPSHYLDQASPPDTLSFAPSIVAPGIGRPHAWVRVSFPGDGVVCHGASITHYGATDEPIPFDTAGLRRPVPTDPSGSTWAWHGEGALGEVLSRSWTLPAPVMKYPDGPDDLHWSLMEDPHQPPLPAVFPELPVDLPPLFTPPIGEPELLGIGQADDEAITSYAEVVASGVWVEPTTVRVRSSGPCSP